MFVYLSKKVAIANNVKLNCVHWSSSGWIAAGGDNGILKILKLDSGKDKPKNVGGVVNLSVNQTLEGHTGNVQNVTWNEHYERMTSCDDNGLVIVWMLHKGTWYEEMLNNKHKSIVRGLAWDHNGQRICVIYEDGNVMVGTVDGVRIWGKEFKKLGLTAVQWSSNSKYILFGTRNGELHLYDEDGIFSMKIRVICLPNVQVIVHIASIDWYNGRNGFYEENCPVLVVAYQSGHLQLMRNQHDDNPVILDIGMCVVKCRWNHDGSILAAIGTTILSNESKETGIIQFFSPYGELIRTLKLPSPGVADCAWENNSLKIAIASDMCIFFANIKPSYTWCYFSNTVVYAIKSTHKYETLVTFWNIKHNECNQKIVKSLLSLAAHKDHCVLGVETQKSSAQYMLMVCNTLTTVIDCKFMDLKPIWSCMNSTHIFVASQENFIVWHYLTPKSRSSMFKLGNTRHKKERLYHIDDTPSGVAEVIQDLDKSFDISSKSQSTRDPICCMACSEKILLIGRKSGTIQRYTLPQVALIQRLALSTKPQTIAINCNSTKFSVIDCTGYLSIMTLHKEVTDKYGISKEESEQQERRDVWDMRWASDDPQYLAIMEKTRMYVLKDGFPEEPINSSAYIADFENLEIKGILLDEAITQSDQPNPDNVINFEVKSLRDTRDLLQKVGIQEATTFIERNPHPRLWRLLAEAALHKLDLSTAEMAYVRRNDYAGIQLIKKLSNIQNIQLKKAAIAAYFNDFDQAESLCLQADRRDLAITQREKLGDWFRVVELMKTASVSSDSQLINAWNNIGDYFLDRNKWEAAKEYYSKSGNYEKLIICYQYLEDYEALESCISLLPEKSPLLEKIGEIFFNVGMCCPSVDAYLKYGAHQLAAEVCVKLNQWDRALQLANQFPVNAHIIELFEKQVNQLLNKGKLLECVQLYKIGERYMEAAELLFKIAGDQRDKCKPMLMKKMYILVGLLVEDYISYMKTAKLESEGTRNKIVTNIDVDSIRNIRLLDKPWHSAEAYHLLMLSQFQLMNGNTEIALRIAVRLRNYEEVLNALQIYSIIATCAICCRAFETASKAFAELESLPTEHQAEYELIATNIFRKYEPKDPPNKLTKCSNCLHMNSLWDSKCSKCDSQIIICMGSGQHIENVAESWQCGVCKHFVLHAQMIGLNTCPLCHSSTSI